MMDQDTCGKLIGDWFAIQGIKADPQLLASWLYAGGDFVTPKADIIDLGPHDRMTPDQLFAQAAREPWEKAIVCGFHKDGDELVVRSSHISREFALWIAEHLRLHVLGRL